MATGRVRFINHRQVCRVQIERPEVRHETLSKKTSTEVVASKNWRENVNSEKFVAVETQHQPSSFRAADQIDVCTDL